MLTSGIGSRSRSAGKYLRIGRDPAAEPPTVEEKRRRGRQRTAGRYLRIGRAGESADRELMASGTATKDSTPEQDVADMIR